MSFECGSAEHDLTRRQVLGAFAGAAGASVGLGGLLNPAVADQIKRKQKQVLLIWTDGGMSQFESWNPKPGTEHGGPFRAIPTTVPGLQFSELMPKTAKQAHHLAVVRSMKTKDENHSSGVPRILRGDPPNRGVDYPHLGSAVAKFMHPEENTLPPYIHVKPGNSAFHYRDAGFLGAKYGALTLGDGRPPVHVHRPETVTDDVELARQELRQRHNRRFAVGRQKGPIDAHTYAYNMAARLMSHVDLFDPSKLSKRDIERYGTHQLGRHLLQARRLLEAGTTFVRVTSYHWDTHGDNFNSHLRMMPDFDRPFAALIEDLHASGMLENVLVIAMSEFGRTPKINEKLGRDHWPESWSLALAGCGLKSGVIIGDTDKLGLDILTEPYDIGHLFFTVFTALGLNPLAKYEHKGQSLPAIDPNCHKVIKGVLA